ncbi:MAG: GTP-binding protein [Anaerolineales bacterium]|nr:GTP-binding protein [Anaerolineales bacterium]
MSTTQVIRSKGIAFFTDHNPVLVSQAGALCEVEELDPVEGQDDAEDTSTELVFIGQNLPKDEILSALEKCQVSKST